MNRARDIELRGQWGSLGVRLYPYQLGLGLSLAFWPCIRDAAFGSAHRAPQAVGRPERADVASGPGRCGWQVHIVNHPAVPLVTNRRVPPSPSGGRLSSDGGAAGSFITPDIPGVIDARSMRRRLPWQKREVPPEWFNTPILADNRRACELIPDGSIDLVFTDPPYPDMAAYRWLGKTARRVLKPGGWLYAYTGNISTIKAANALAAGGLDWAGMICVMGAGGFVHRFRMIGVWKPVLRFTKGKASGRWMTNMNSAAPDKRYHRWGQGASPAYAAVRGTTRIGDVVLDPFCGGATTAVVCVALNRRFLTFDDDPDAIRVAKERLAWADLPLFNGAEVGGSVAEQARE